MKKGKALFAALIVLQSLSAAAGETEDARYQQCAVDLCGSPQSQLKLTGQSFSSPSHETKAYLNKVIQPLMDQAVEITVSNKKTEFEIANQFFKGAALALSPEQKSFLVLSIFMGQHKYQVLNSITSPDGRLYQLNEAQLKKEIPTLSTQEAAVGTQFFNAYFANQYFQKMLVLQSYEYDLYKELYNPYTWYLFLANQEVQGRELTKKLGFAFTKNFELDLIQKAKEGTQELTLLEKARVMEGLITLSQFKALTEPSIVAAASNYPIDIAQWLKQVRWENRYKEFADSNSKVMPKQIVAVKKKCEEYLTQSIAATPSQLRLNQFKKILEVVKSSSKKTLPLYLNGEALQKATQKIETLGWTLPQSLEEANLKSEQMLENYLNLEKSYKKQISVNVNEVDRASLALRAAIEGSSRDKQGLFNGLELACESLKPAVITDKAIYSLNKIVVSWQSIMYPEYGAGTTAHEIGHIVSNAINNVTDQSAIRGYVDTRTCIHKNNILLNAMGGNKTDNLTQYIEEDWADAFSNSVMKDVSKTWAYSKNFSCVLLGMSIDNKKMQYKDLELISLTGIDTHSMNLTRALRTQISSGLALPASCSNAIPENQKINLAEVCSK